MSFAIFPTRETMARDILQLQRYTVADGLPNNLINSITEDPNGDIWIATWNGLCRWHNNALSTYTETKDHQRLGRINNLWAEAKDHIAYQDESGAFFSFYPKTGRRVKMDIIRKPSIKRNSTYQCGEDEQGVFIRHNQITYHIPFDENNKTESRLRAFYHDRENRLWFNFNGALYLATFISSPFFHFTSCPYSDSPFNATVRSIYCSNRGNLLFGTRNTQLHGLRDKPLSLNDNPYSLTEDKSGRLWIAMRDTGIGLIPDSDAEADSINLIFKGIPIFSLLYESGTDEIWAGTWGKGIYTFNGDAEIPIPTDSILENAYVHSMRKCRNDNIAVCTKNGLHIVNPDKDVLFSSDSTLNVICAIETTDSDILFSTMGQGLYRLSFTETGIKPVINEIKIPYDDVILNMLYDGDSCLWLIADTRLFRFDNMSHSPEIFDSNDFGKELAFSEGASCLYRDSLLYLGVTPGILEINLNELKHYVQSRNLSLSEERTHVQRQRLLKIIIVTFFVILILLVFLWLRKKKRNKIEITLKKPIAENSSDNDFINCLTETLQERIEDPDVDMEQIAKTLGMTRNTFYQRCKEIMHATPAALLQDMRIERACQLLQSGESRIKEVAWKSGFTDAKYFTKVFKSKKGITPTEYIIKMGEIKPE